jgi:hypothetical protein
VGYIYGEGRHQGTLFPVLLDDLIPGDHVCRVIDAKTVLGVDGFSVVAARVEIGFASMAYNIKRMANVFGAAKLTEALHRS